MQAVFFSSLGQAVSIVSRYGSPGGDDAWRAMRMKEPPNAHSHVIQFVVGTSEAIPIHEGKMTIGTFQNVIVVDADGPAGDLGSPKTRTICVQVQGSDE